MLPNISRRYLYHFSISQSLSKMSFRRTNTKTVTFTDDQKDKSSDSSKPPESSDPSKSTNSTDPSKTVDSTDPSKTVDASSSTKTADSTSSTKTVDSTDPPKLTQFDPDTPAPVKEFFPVDLKMFRDGLDYGRGWRVEELRLKSNLDLHKLWYILLKELNLLLTVEYQARQKKALIKRGSRKTYVEQSMLNLKQVLQEREEVIQGAFQLQEEGHGEEKKAEIAQEDSSLLNRIMKFFRMR